MKFGKPKKNCFHIMVFTLELETVIPVILIQYWFRMEDA